MSVSPYSQGDKNFDILARMRADNIFKDYEFYKEVFCNNEIIFSNFKHIVKKYRNKKIMIIGGGPSTRDLLSQDYQDVFDNYDYVWSCNSFFLNTILKNIKIDLAMMMLEPDLDSKEFLEYSKKFNPTIGLELHDKWRQDKLQYENLFMMQTRFYGITGVCQRMIILACFVGCKEVGFVGLDGLKSIKKGDHSFEKNKNTLPSITNEEVFQYQCDVFWDYINNNFKKQKIVNHGYDNNYHRILRER
jgi:hypothetical protein